MPGLVSRYPPGAGIGGHRDALMFGPVVVGVSLGTSCHFKLRRDLDGTMRVYDALLPSRSWYVLSGEARVAWQHHIPPVSAMRYSLSFCTVRDPSRWD